MSTPSSASRAVPASRPCASAIAGRSSVPGQWLYAGCTALAAPPALSSEIVRAQLKRRYAHSSGPVACRRCSSCAAATATTQ